jgi:hypothetical protein
MQARVQHTVLALLILLQSLTAVAMVPAGPTPAHDDMQSSMTLCHDTVAPMASAVAHVEQGMVCCDNMAGGSCYMNCISMLVTISPSYWSGSTSFHQVQVPGLGYTAHATSLSELFRPPRIS